MAAAAKVVGWLGVVHLGVTTTLFGVASLLIASLLIAATLLPLRLLRR